MERETDGAVEDEEAGFKAKRGMKEREVADLF